MLLYIKVHKGDNRIIANGNKIDIYTSKPSVNNKANLDIINQLSHYYINYSNIKILHGLKSYSKVIDITRD